MKIYIIHDESGAIISTGAAAEQAEGQFELAAGPGQHVVDIDSRSIRLPKAPEGHVPTLGELSEHLIAHHRIVRGKLAARDD